MTYWSHCSRKVRKILRIIAFLLYLRCLNKTFFHVMKYNQLFAELTAAGCSVHRHGANHDIWFSPLTGNHDIWFSPLTGNRFPLPRHGGQEVPKRMERKARKVLLGE